MPETVYEFGDVAVLSVAFTVASTPTDPDTVALTVRAPDGTLTVYTTALVHDGAGAYHLDLTADQAGTWAWEWEGTGAAADIETGSFYVKPSISIDPAEGDLCSLNDVLRYVPGFEADDPENGTTVAALATLITSQSVDILEQTGREFRAITDLDPRSFDIDEGHLKSRRLAIGDLSEITGVAQYRSGSLAATLVSPNIILEPRNRQPWQPITHLRFPAYSSSPVFLAVEDIIVVTGTWGFPRLPNDIRQACAKLVILRYLTDIVTTNTRFRDAALGMNIGALYKSASQVVYRYSIP